MTNPGVALPNDGLLEQDFYGHRLAAVNATNPVIANENILNSQGVLLVAKGSELSQAKAEVIARHRLIKPLEHSVDVSKSLDANGLYQILENYTASLPGLKNALDNEEIWNKIKILCSYYERFSLVRQKLTVLSSQLPDIYNDSLYSALAGTAIAMQLQLSEESIKAIFIAGLMHNSGYLNLNPELEYDENSNENNITREVQAHPIIAKHFLDQIPGLTKTAGTAVAEHHERTDGTGYPKSKFGSDLCIEGQIVGMTDRIINSYKRCLDYGEHAHQLILLILQLNDNVHFEEVYKAAALLVRKGPMPTNPPQQPPNPKLVLVQEERILVKFDASKKLAFVLMKSTRNRFTKSIASMIGRLANSIVSSGMMQEEYKAWLKGLIEQDNPEEHLNLVKCHVMMGEIELQMDKLQVIMWRSIEKISDAETSLKEDCILSYKHIESLG
ncbi:Cyclic di-GMP phosphodiesterase response regulator RpfG [Thalassocella blandensis]|nr:Cyclic di-GMP phosphodiesterase response regulator RpfG [Thalassocella blandensis]